MQKSVPAVLVILAVAALRPLAWDHAEQTPVGCENLITPLRRTRG